MPQKKVKDKIKQAIKEQDIQYSDDASFVLYELHHEHEFLLVREKEDYFRIAVKDIIYIEAKVHRYWHIQKMGFIR